MVINITGDIGEIMKIDKKQIRNYRLCANHLNRKIHMDGMINAAGVCGLQNSPPGAWETALFNRLSNCSLEALNDALHSKKKLLQAWSYRGAPVVFPTEQSDVFLTSLIAQDGELPWIYTRGITGALDYLQMSFDDVLARLKKAITYLDGHTIKSKEILDQTLAHIIYYDLPKDKQTHWCAPSMYGNPEKQTVGGAAVSFLLRPCSFYSLVVFGERKDVSPTFTSFKNWTGHMPGKVQDADKELVRKFLHCYGPATVDYFMYWLGCSPKQAHRLWNRVADEIVAVEVEGKSCYILEEDMGSLISPNSDKGRLLMRRPHVAHLGHSDRTTILENKDLHKKVWKSVANPGVVLRGGRIIGIWKSKTLKDKLDISITMWESLGFSEQKVLKQLAENYAVFRMLHLRNLILEKRSYPIR